MPLHGTLLPSLLLEFYRPDIATQARAVKLLRPRDIETHDVQLAVGEAATSPCTCLISSVHRQACETYEVGEALQAETPAVRSVELARVCSLSLQSWVNFKRASRGFSSLLSKGAPRRRETELQSASVRPLAGELSVFVLCVCVCVCVRVGCVHIWAWFFLVI